MDHALAAVELPDNQEPPAWQDLWKTLDVADPSDPDVQTEEIRVGQEPRLSGERLGVGDRLVSESAGTRTAMIYAWRYPKSIHRSVMIGVNPPGNFVWNPKTTGEQIRRYAALCAQATSCRSRTPDLAASLKSVFAHVPSHWLFLPIKKGDFKAAAFFGLINETSAGGGPIASPLTIDSLLSAGDGDASGAWFLSLLAQLTFPSSFVWGDMAAISRSDATYAKHFFASGAGRGSLIGSPGNDLIWAGGSLLDAWPANPSTPACKTRTFRRC